MDRASSKGNQMKFKIGGNWYKADYMGYEGLAEYVVSCLLSFSSLNETEYVKYETEVIKYKENTFVGCKSRDFTGDWNLITLERLFKNSYGQSLNRTIFRIPDRKERLKMIVEQVERITGITGFGIYMSKILTVDALFLNEDRHTHNLAILTDGNGKYRLAPIFDNGACLLSDTRMDYPLSGDTIRMIGRVKAKTFSDSFDEQLDAAEELYGCNIRFSYDYNDVAGVVNLVGDYSEEIKERVIDVVMTMKNKYRYLFP